MSNPYSISTADIVPQRLGQADYDALTQDADGAAEIELSDIRVNAEEEAASYLGGTPTASANLARCKPHVVSILVYMLYARRETEGEDYTMPKAVVERYKAACKWLDTRGRAALANEGGELPDQDMGVSYSNPTSHWTRDQQDYL